MVALVNERSELLMIDSVSGAVRIADFSSQEDGICSLGESFPPRFVKHRDLKFDFININSSLKGALPPAPSISSEDQPTHLAS